MTNHSTRFFSLAPAIALALVLGACAGGPGSSISPTSTQTPGEPAAPSSADQQRQAEFNKSLDRWHGARVQELVAKMGRPNSSSKAEDGRLAYVYARSGQISGPGGPSTFSCVVSYLIDEKTDRIVGHRIAGC